MVFRTINLHSRPEHRAIGYRDLRGIENGAAGIEINIFAQRNVETVSAMKRRFKKCAFPDRIKEGAQQRCNRPALIRRHRIVLVDGLSCPPAQYIQLRIHAAVPFARGHFFPFGGHCFPPLKRRR
ncbi:hypothetical protein D3C86_1567740 [compost metagenome]